MADFDLLIKNGTIVTTESQKQGDIAVKDGKITQVETENSLQGTAEREIDATGLHILPGLIDSHLHFNEPGRTEWEGLDTGSKALVAGGAATFFDMPLNSTPPVVDREQLEIKRNLAEEKSIANAKFWGGLVPGHVKDIRDMYEGGVIGFKAFALPSGIDDFESADDETLYEGMKEIAAVDSILGVHSESAVMTSHLAEEKQKEGKTSAYDFVESRPITSELEAVRRVLSYAEQTGCRVHIVHATNRDVVREVNEARERGIDATVETCPHYLALTTDDLAEMGGIAKCTPPLRSQEVQDDLWEAVLNGEVDTIGSDHSPAPEDLKTITDNFFEGWGGISSVQSTLNILLTEGYFKRGLPLEKIVELMAENPAKRFGIEGKGAVKSGFDADLTLIDLNKSFDLHKEDLYYRHKHSPYIGKTMRGEVAKTIVNGNVVFEDRQLV